MNTTTKGLLTPGEVAAELRLSVTTIYRLIQADKVPAVRIGGQYRIPADALRERLSVPSKPDPVGAA